MQIELRPIDSIRPYENNPRLNNEAVAAVANSLKEFGFRQPIVVDGESVIVVGHTRYKAALKLGLKQVPVHTATDLTPAQIKRYRIADKRDRGGAGLETMDPRRILVCERDPVRRAITTRCLNNLTN